MIGFPRLVPRIVLGLLATITFVHHLSGQQRSQSDHPIIPVIGTVKTISGNVISVDAGERVIDRKSTRLNSSHLGISYAVFCLKKKKKTTTLLMSTILPHLLSLGTSDSAPC